MQDGGRLSPAFSYLSMKSDASMPPPPNFSSDHHRCITFNIRYHLLKYFSLYMLNSAVYGSCAVVYLWHEHWLMSLSWMLWLTDHRVHHPFAATCQMDRFHTTGAVNICFLNMKSLHACLLLLFLQSFTIVANESELSYIHRKLLCCIIR